MYALDPHHSTLNSCFGAFLSVWVHLGPFPYCTKLAAKCAKLVQLMQKFMSRCRVRIFRNERSRSTPLDLKLMFWSVSFHLGAFGTVSLLHETRCKMGQPVAINAKVRARKSRQNFSKLTLPIHTIGPYAQVFICFFPFGCIRDRFATTQNLKQNKPIWCN